MNFDFFLSLLSAALLFKIAILLLLILYIIFTLVVFLQIRTMNRIISSSGSSGVLEIIGAIHIIAALSLFVLALAIL